MSALSKPTAESGTLAIGSRAVAAARPRACLHGIMAYHESIAAVLLSLHGRPRATLAKSTPKIKIMAAPALLE